MTTDVINGVPRELRSVLSMILSALDRDAAEGKTVRGEMAEELRRILTTAQPAADGEREVQPIEVIGYASPGQVEILRQLPRTGGMKVSGRKDERYSEPVVLLSSAISAVMHAVIRCERAGAIKTFMECGYQDGHDEICQYHESKRAAQPQQAVAVTGEVRESIGEAAGILRNMIDSIGVHGNYSQESTLLFLNHALGSIDAALSAHKTGEEE